jgi:Rod binding domain-containing protein
MSWLAPSGLASKVSSADPTVPQPRLVQAAHEFEAAMMKELMAPLLSGHSGLASSTGLGGLGGNDGEAGSDSALGDFAGEALGKALSEHGGFGIARSIIHQLSRPTSGKSNHSGSAPVPVGVTQNNPHLPPK